MLHISGFWAIGAPGGRVDTNLPGIADDAVNVRLRASTGVNAILICGFPARHGMAPCSAVRLVAGNKKPPSREAAGVWFSRGLRNTRIRSSSMHGRRLTGFSGC